MRRVRLAKARRNATNAGQGHPAGVMLHGCMFSQSQRMNASNAGQGKFLLLQNLHFRHPWRSEPGWSDATWRYACHFTMDTCHFELVEKCKTPRINRGVILATKPFSYAVLPCVLPYWDGLSRLAFSRLSFYWRLFSLPFSWSLTS